MKIENSENSFEEVTRKLLHQLRGQKKGVLTSTIYQIFHADHQIADQICREYQIKSNATLEEDLEFVDRTINTIQLPRTFKENNKMEYIILIGIILVGAYTSRQYLNKLSRSHIDSQALVKQPIPTSICLAIPASAVYSVTVGQTITRGKIISLVESATEFLCLDSQKANEIIIDTVNQEISQESQLKFYIRIDIPSGEEIIGVESKYLIKRDIPNPTEGKVIQMGRLRDASVLRFFNRV